MATSSATSSRLFSAFKGKKKKQNRNANEHNHVFALPYDVLVQIIAFLPDSDALLKLSLLSRSLRETLLPALYNCVDLRSSASCRAALTFFLQNPTGSSASLIRSLTLRPSNPERWGGATDKPDEQWVAAAIEQLATAGHLNALHTFVWDGWESPPESLWLALRLNCPYLRSIGTSVGLNSQKIDPESSLFDFRDLRGFSLGTLFSVLSNPFNRQPVTQKYVRWKNLFTGQALPDRFWQMLIHSPNLEDLKLDGSCAISQLWDIRRVLTGRWPRLHTLSIGDLSAQSTDTDFPSATTFLRAQPLITSISFTGGLSAHTNSISALPLAPLPNLRTFVGKVIQLKDASSTLLPCLTEFRFTDHFGTRSSSSLSILTRFYKTTRLELYVNFLDAPTETDIETFFRHLLVPCPILRHLRINATSPFNLVRPANYLVISSTSTERRNRKCSSPPSN
ncbi:F-box domain-containing protein [Mycena chlorophos]|uniref:F-box domain-containing protein n=1 Tax=Mycena chlorophos TaxID=658473 RepID=A0A8H6TE21_MYCCL|nr:F-box domain-containing protein [Mycena chlorophos]